MAEAEALVQNLLAAQNSDGGWPFHTGTSWAEPTGFVVLALQLAKDQSAYPAVSRGVRWLLAQQKSSGGWTPNNSVQECTSVTSIATFAVLQATGRNPSANLDAAVNWTASQVYRDELTLSLLLSKALEMPPAHAPGSVPWFPGTAGWITPTALTALVLLKAASLRNRPDLRTVALNSCSYLLSRRCVDSGWNHGGSKTRSEDATSYPETTGLALLALRAANMSPPPSSIALAEHFAKHPESSEGLAWIQIALNGPTRHVPDPPCLPTPRTTRDTALRLLSIHPLDDINPFLGA